MSEEFKNVYCPECNSPMQKRNGRRGEFYGCKNFFITGCTGTRTVKDVELYDKEVEQQFDNLEQLDKNKNCKNIELIPTLKFPLLSFKFQTFNPVQSEVFKYYDQDINCVVAATTSAGKTTVAEMFMSHSIAQGKKAIFLSPLKAVSQEKYEDWTCEDHAWSKLNVSIVTGDYQLTDKRVEELNQANIIIMTCEMLDSRTRRIAIEKNSWLLEAGTIVQDESHSIGQIGRGDKIESAMMRFSKQNPACRIIFLSATMPNVNEISKWLTMLNNKKSELINSDYRPCQLDIHYEMYDDYGKYQNVENNKIERVVELTQKYKDDKTIVFVHSKAIGRKIYQALKDIKENVEIHNSELNLKDRIKVTKEFREKGKLRIIVATSTLALGINLPARRVIVTGVHRGIQEVEPLDIVQMCGRSGRVGLDPKGDAHVLLPQRKFNHYKSWCKNIPPIKSTINNQDVLAFHIISEISEGEIYNVQTLVDWYNRSLAAFQSNFLDRVDAENLLIKLNKIKVIEKKDDRYIVTKLGKVAAYLYYSPYSISSWYFNFNKIFSDNNLDDYSISWALANIPDNNSSFIGKELNDIVQTFINVCNCKKYIISNSCASVGIVFHSCLNYSEEIGAHLKSQVKFDSERMCTALEMIDKMYAHWNKSDFWKRLQMRIEYEISEKHTELCTLKGIGGIRVRKLFDMGIQNINDFKQKSSVSKEVLGDFLYQKILVDNNLYC
jgi:helicase